jgi:WD40 repeat protein
MAYANPIKSMSRKQGWPRIFVATVAIVALGWAGIGLDPANLDLDGWRWIVEADSPKPRLVRVFDHDGEIGDIAWSPDGRKIAAGGQLHRALMIWDANTGALLHNLNREDGSISAVAWSPNGKYVAAGRWFTLSTRSHVAINIWDGETGRRMHNLLGSLPVAQGANDVPPRALSFSPDSTLLASGHREAISIHEVVSGRLVTTVRGHGSIGRVLAFSPSGKQIVTSGEYQRSPIQMFDVATGLHLRSLSGDPERPAALAYRPDGMEIATADHKRPIVTLWDAEGGRPSRVLVGHTHPIYALAYSLDGTLLASAAPGGSVIVWDADSGARLLTLPSPTDLTGSIAFSPDGRYLAAPVERQVRIWDLAAIRRPRN